MATLIIPTPLRKYADGAAQFQTDSLNVELAIEELTEQFPDLKKHLLDGNDKIRSYIKVFIGDDDIKALDGLESELNDSDIVSIVPAIAGGLPH